MNLGVAPSQPAGKYSLLSSSVMAAHTVLSHCLMMECESLGPLASAARSMALLICFVGPFVSRRSGFDKSLGLIWAWELRIEIFQKKKQFKIPTIQLFSYHHTDRNLDLATPLNDLIRRPLLKTESQIGISCIFFRHCLGQEPLVIRVD